MWKFCLIYYFNYIIFKPDGFIIFTFNFHLFKTRPAIVFSLSLVFCVLFSGAVIIATSKQFVVGSFGSICFAKLSIKFLIIVFAFSTLLNKTLITCCTSTFS